jgi:hypothetical protein
VRLDQLVRFLGLLGGRGPAGPDRPHRLVRDREPLEVVVGDDRLDRGQLAHDDVLRLPRLALGLRLADARDHVQPRIK